MKRTSSVVWQFFDRVMEDGRCFSVTCKLCDSEYKYCGNTTNLRVHLNHKHPIQWELIQNGTLDNSTLRALDEDSPSQSRYDKRKKFSNHKESKKVEVSENSETESENVNEEGMHLINQLTNGNEEWLEESYETYEPKQKKHRYAKVKKEVITAPKRIFKIRDKSYDKPKPQVVVGPCNDEYSAFGEYIGNKLRKFDNEQTKSNVQQLISTVIWQAQYGMYDDPDVVKQIIMNCFNMMTVVRINNDDTETVGQNQSSDSLEIKANE